MTPGGRAEAHEPSAKAVAEIEEPPQEQPTSTPGKRYPRQIRGPRPGPRHARGCQAFPNDLDARRRCTRRGAPRPWSLDGTESPAGTDGSSTSRGALPRKPIIPANHCTSTRSARRPRTEAAATDCQVMPGPGHIVAHRTSSAWARADAETSTRRRQGRRAASLRTARRPARWSIPTWHHFLVFAARQAGRVAHDLTERSPRSRGKRRQKTSATRRLPPGPGRPHDSRWERCSRPAPADRFTPRACGTTPRRLPLVSGLADSRGAASLPDLWPSPP
jgi:hypothetical protein